ncbi:MAG: T9SS type A sorting domain-containing protein [Saprospiraceae bacterium]
MVDVTYLVQDMVDHPDESFGFKFSYLDEIPYKINLYASSENPDISLWPELTITYQVSTSADSPLTSEPVRIFPNPSSGLVHVQSSISNPIQGVRVYNSIGQLVKTLEGSVTQLNISDAGMYYVEILTEAGKTTRKVVINN